MHFATTSCTILNILTEAITDKYLGLPPIVGVDRSDCFQHLIDQVISKLIGWKEKILSFGGKEVLLKWKFYSPVDLDLTNSEVGSLSHAMRIRRGMPSGAGV
jgi:hypothetical protein